MKQLFSFLAFLPLVLFAQKKLPLIESITSDTLKGKYQQISFTYDQNNRVTNIIKTKCKTKKTSPNDVFPLIDTESIQKFNYSGMSNIPVSRKITSFEFDPVDQASFWTYIQNEVFIYKDGKLIQDSIENKENRLHLDEDNKDNDKPYYFKGTLEYSNKSIKYIVNRNYLTKGMYDYDQGETTELLINSQLNIEKDANEEFIKSHSSSNPPYFTYTKFDKAINPFHYLNIAEFLPHEKFFFSYEIDELIDKKTGDYLNWGNSDFNWYFFNKNNITSYSITRGETDSEFKDVINLAYTYNKFNLPIQCIEEIRKEFKSDGTLASKHHKRFTFRYRK